MKHLLLNIGKKSKRAFATQINTKKKEVQNTVLYKPKNVKSGNWKVSLTGLKSSMNIFLAAY